MDKDIRTLSKEERAELNLQYERDFCGNNLSDNMVKRAYLKGDTERKAIDKRLILDAYCKRCQDMGGGYPCSHKCYEYLEFEKTLEE